MISLAGFPNANASVGEVWEHRMAGLTNEVHLVLSSSVDDVGTWHHKLLNLLSGVIHPDVLIGLSSEPDYGWRRVS